MQSPHPQPTPTTEHPTQQAQDTAYYREILHGFIAQGANMARVIHDQATAPIPTPTPETNPAPAAPVALSPPDLPALAAAFDRLARAVRRTIALARRLNEPPRHATTNPTIERLLRTVANTCTTARNPARNPVQDLSKIPDHELADYDRAERLDSLDDEDELDDAPIDDLIASLRHDLGLSPAQPQTPAQIPAQSHNIFAAHPATPPNPPSWATPSAPPRVNGRRPLY